MRHAQVLRRLSGHLQGELSAPERARVDAHLDACESCRREARALEQTVDLLRGLPDPSPPTALAASVIERIRAGEGRSSPLATLRDGIGRWLAAPLSAPLSALAVGALGLMVLRPELLPDPFRLGGDEPVSSRVEVPAFAPTNRLPGAFVDRTVPVPQVAPGPGASPRRHLGAGAAPSELPPLPGSAVSGLEVLLTNPGVYLDTLTSLTPDDREQALSRLVEQALRSGRTDELLRALDGTEHAIAPLVVGRLNSSR